MGSDENVRTGRHCVFRMHVHLVFVTKYRHSVFTDRHLTRCEEIMRAVCEDFEAELVEFNGEANHVHLLYWRAQRLWSGSYFAGSVGGAPLSIVKQYIEQQNRPL
ncbi:IS200/IS605 family transposase [Streptomyces collinus]|uniref:IS200/IS605 family transposase n=1 Tax=Streptomyces collinus TaxID=42684 RepID=UPI0036CFDB90